jgi:F-type H+-transporting ATPase subunit b
MRRGGLMMLAFVICLVWGAAAAPRAVAEPEAGHNQPAAGHTAKGDHGEASGADSNSVNKILDLAIWTVVVFVVLLWVLHKYAWKPMLTGLQKREDNIRSALDEAQKTRDEAHALRLQLQKDMSEAHAKATGIIDEARKVGQSAADEIAAKARAEIQAERERLQREIEMQTTQAIQRIWSQAADLATLASAKALGKGISADGHRQLINDALAEIKAAGANRNA